MLGSEEGLCFECGICLFNTQEELREWLESQEPWQRSGGIDHVLLSVHPVALARLGKWKPFCTYLIVDFAFRESWEVNNTSENIGCMGCCMIYCFLP